MAKLTDKQKRFCEEYVLDLNATQSAIRSGYSENTARQIASENLAKLDIQEYISELQKDSSDELKITKNDTLKLTWSIANDSEAKDNDKLKAVEIVNKMLGFNDLDNAQKGTPTVTIFQLPENGRT